jgi:hypothetical protein
VTKKIIYTEEDRRIEVESPLMRESLVNETLRASTASARERGVIPGLDIISFGGHSIIDRGARRSCRSSTSSSRRARSTGC